MFEVNLFFKLKPQKPAGLLIMGWKLITKRIEFSVAHYHDVTGLISQSGGRRPTADGKVANQEAGAPVQTPTRFSAYSPSGAYDKNS